MTATNHVLTGALLIAVIPRPEIALPVALLSHLVLDTLPHFGWDEHTSWKFFVILATDIMCASGVLLALAVLQPAQWLLMALAGIVAASPDLLWLYYLVYDLKGESRKYNTVARFLSWIQWGEFKGGVVIELIYAVVCGSLLLGRVQGQVE